MAGPLCLTVCGSWLYRRSMNESSRPRGAERFSLAGRVAVVTGAGSGLGQAVAIGFAEVGARVVAADLPGADFAEIEAASEDRMLAVEVDVTDREAVDQTAATVLADFGRADILVNSAGIGGRSRAEDYPADLLAKVLAVNLVGTLSCCQAF